MEAKADGSALEPWQGKPLTLGGEINKLARRRPLGQTIPSQDSSHHEQSGDGSRSVEPRRVPWVRGLGRRETPSRAGQDRGPIKNVKGGGRPTAHGARVTATAFKIGLDTLNWVQGNQTNHPLV